MSKGSTFIPDYDYDFFLLAIVTQLRDFQLAWLLNQQLNIALRKETGFELFFKKKNTAVLFTWYRYIDEINKHEIHLLGNKMQSEFILPEVKQADFILMIKGFASDELKKKVTEKIKALHQIQTSVVLNPSDLKSKDNLILE